MNYNLFSRIILFHIPEFIILVYLTGIFFKKSSTFTNILDFVFLGFIVLFFFKSSAILIGIKYLYLDKLKQIKILITNFKMGKFASVKIEINGNDELSNISQDLTVIGKYVDNTISSLKNEIQNLRELYNNIVYSITSYLIILNKNRKIIFANDVFCKKFQLDLDEIIGKDINEIFFFVAEKLNNSIKEIDFAEESIILKKTHLLSKNWISVIADIKLSNMIVQQEKQVVLIIDDITSKCRKDYQINLISQVTESIQRDEEIHRILYTILYGITSGAGLGFNRAILFLLDQKKKYLIGEMAVGPDSIEEAIDIWNSMPQGGIDIVNLVNTFNNPERKGRKLLEKVVETKFRIESENIFAKSFNDLDNIHIYDSWNDDSVDDYIKNFMDVTEFVIVPLIAENRAIGIIVADNKFNQVPIGNDHIELLSIFAVQASLLIESYHNVSTLTKEMSKIKDRQEAIIETEKLAAIGRISSHIAHEIRNPLVTMGGYARRITQLSPHDEKIRNAADVILKESVRLESILSNVMDLTKPHALIKKLNNVNDIILDTIDLLKNVFQEKRIKISTTLNNDIPLVNSDLNQLKQVILNLLQNAIDATPEDGNIEITTDLYNKNNSIVILIRDTGTGIEIENLDNIFEPFFTTKITGVGLGLAIVQKIIEDHNGNISVCNRTTGGTEFSLSLPVPQ